MKWKTKTRTVECMKVQRSHKPVKSVQLTGVGVCAGKIYGKDVFLPGMKE